MVLELKVPHGHTLSSLIPLLPILSAYILSFVYLAIYWNNHHHMFHLVHKINGKILWSNLHLLFWLSLIPFATAWINEGGVAPIPTFVYGVVLAMSGIAYFVLERTIVASQGAESKLQEAVGRDIKGKGSIVLYLCAFPLAFFAEWVSMGIYILVALAWLIPDRRIESKFST